MKYLAGLDVSLEETAICVVDETGRIMKELRAASERDPLVATLQRTGSAAGAHRFGNLLSNGVAIRRAKACRAAGDLYRSRQANAPMKTMPNKTGPQRCPGSGTDHADGLVPGGACQEPAMSVLAFASGRPPHGPQRRGAARVQRDNRAVTSVSSRRRCCGAAARGSLPAIPRQACRSFQSCVTRPAARATAVCCA